MSMLGLEDPTTAAPGSDKAALNRTDAVAPGAIMTANPVTSLAAFRAYREALKSRREKIIGNSNRSPSAECGMKNLEECAIHAVYLPLPPLPPDAS